MKHLEDRVRVLLEKHPHLRDNDDALIANLWWRSTDKKLTFDFLQELSIGKLPSSESIVRLRRKVQSEYPELRGAKYLERINKQKKVKKDLGYENRN